MTTAASLMVRIGADVEEFTRGMDKAQKAAKRGFSEISEAGAKMTERFSIEFAAAASEFAHLAAEAQDASARLDRVFGSAAGEVKRQLEEMTDVIPESVAAMQALAVKSDNMLQGLGYGAEKAAKLSIEMVKLAGDMAAFAHVPIGDALDALDKGLAGKTRGLIQYGIVISQQAIHQEAMRRGLVDNHRALTELGTAEIAEYLIRQQSTRITGEAARTAGQASNSFKFLKVAAEEAGVSLGNIVLPAAVALTSGLRNMFDAIEHASTGVKTFALAAGALIATVGPALLIIGRLGTEMIALQRAAALLAGGEGIAAAFGGLAATTLPILTLTAALVALTAAGVAAYYATKNVMRNLGIGDVDGIDAAEEDAAANDKVQAQLRAHRHKYGFPKRPGEEGNGGSGALSRDPRSALEIFKEHASLVQDNFQYAVEAGSPLEGSLARMNTLYAEADALLKAQNGHLNEKAKLAQDVLRKTQETLDVARVAAAMQKGNGAVPTQVASINTTSDTAIQMQLARSAIGSETSLRTREEALRLQDTFNVVRVAAVELGERFRSASRDFGVALSQFKSQWGSGGGIKASAISGLEQAGAQLLTSFTPAALAAQAFGKVMQGLQPVLDAVMEPLVMLGRIIGIEIMPVMHPLFEVLKLLGISVAFTAEIFYSVAGGVAKVVGGLISAIGSFIAHIPFLGGLGRDIQNFGNGISNVGRGFLESAAELDTARRQLQGMEFGQTADAVTQLGQAAAQAAQSILNLPAGYKVAAAYLRSIDGVGPAASRGTVPGAGTTVAPIIVQVISVLDGQVVARSAKTVFKREAQAQFGDSSLWGQVA